MNNITPALPSPLRREGCEKIPLTPALSPESGGEGGGEGSIWKDFLRKGFMREF